MQQNLKNIIKKLIFEHYSQEFLQDMQSFLKEYDLDDVEVDVPAPTKTPTRETPAKPKRGPNPLRPPREAPQTNPKAEGVEDDIQENEKEVIGKIADRFSRIKKKKSQ